MDDWQPIETAPRDGTVIDLGCVNDMDREHENESHGYRYGFVRFTDCRWHTEYTQVPRWVDRSTEETIEDNGWRATHWMPLPEPPKPLNLGPSVSTNRRTPV